MDFGLARILARTTRATLEAACSNKARGSCCSTFIYGQVKPTLFEWHLHSLDMHGLSEVLLCRVR